MQLRLPPVTIDLSALTASATINVGRIVVPPYVSTRIDKDLQGRYPAAELGSLEVSAASLVGPSSLANLLISCTSPGTSSLLMRWDPDLPGSTYSRLDCPPGEASVTFQAPRSSSALELTGYVDGSTYTLVIAASQPTGIP